MSLMHEPTEAEAAGFLALTTSEGGQLWVRPDALYSIEKSPKEQNTIIKLLGDGGAMSGVVTVAETPEGISEKMLDLQSARHTPTREEVLAMVAMQIKEAEDVGRWRAEAYQIERVPFIVQQDEEPFVVTMPQRLTLAEQQTMRDEQLEDWKRESGYPVGDEEGDRDDDQ
jgi:hypothetical protein